MTSSSVLNLEINADWKEILDNLPNDANEAMVCKLFVEPLLTELEFNKQECYREFPTGKSGDEVDYAARKNFDSDIFIKSKTNPSLLIEVKGRATKAGKINLAEGTPQYKQTKEQITKYLLSPKCQTAEWGIITNGDFIQLFRRHGKVVFPATKNYIVKPSNIAEIVARFKDLINNPPRALSICVYNDKGGVGKTTTIANLASILGLGKKKVLVIDFDAQQTDLTASLAKEVGKVKLSDCLIDNKPNIHDTIQPFEVFPKGKKIHVFDLIPSDSELANLVTHKDKETGETLLSKVQGNFTRLRKSIAPLLDNYDYIIFDCPTNWGFYSQSCVYAADVVLIPTQHDNFASLKNAKKVIKEYLPEIQLTRKEKGEYGIPTALPIFFNNHKQTDASIKRTYEEIKAILKKGEKAGKIIWDEDLIPFFFPKIIDGKRTEYVFTLPQYAIISSAGFSKIPAVLNNKIAHKHYFDLVKEYFL